MTNHLFDLAHKSIRHIAPYQPGKPINELRRELGIQDIIKLASNENPLGPSPQAMAAAQQSLAEIALYPDANGFELKTALSTFLQVDTRQITLGNGSDSLFSLIAQAFVAPGQEMIVAQYAFVTYTIIAHSVQAKLVTVPARDWGHDLTAMAQAVTPNTRLIFIANPNNPTGTWVDTETLLQFLTQLPKDVLVVLDEAYYEYAANQPGYPNGVLLQQQFPNLIVTRTFSKVYGLAGLRVGYALAHSEVTDILNRVRLPFNVSTPALAAATAAIADQAFVQTTLAMNQQGREQLAHGFSQMGLDYLPSPGNFFTLHVGEHAATIFQSLLRLGVIVRPLANYAMPEHLRITIGLPHENARLLDSLQKVLYDNRITSVIEE